MSNWTILLLATAVIASTLFLYGLAKTKENSDKLLEEYQRLLGDTRNKMLSKKNRPADNKGNKEVMVVGSPEESGS